MRKPARRLGLRDGTARVRHVQANDPHGDLHGTTSNASRPRPTRALCSREPVGDLGRVPGPVRPPRVADPRLPPEAHPRPGCGDGAHRRDLRPGLAVARALPGPRRGTAAPWLFGHRAARPRVVRPPAERPSRSPRIAWPSGLAARRRRPSTTRGSTASTRTSRRPWPRCLTASAAAIELRVLGRPGATRTSRELDITPDTARVRVHRGLSCDPRRLAEPTGQPTVTHRTTPTNGVRMTSTAGPLRSPELGDALSDSTARRTRRRVADGPSAGSAWPSSSSPSSAPRTVAAATLC